MANLQERLKELRGSLSQDEVAKVAEITRVAYGNYEKGKRIPNANVLIKLADYYGVSLDYLVGVSNIKARDAIVVAAFEEGRTAMKKEIVEHIKDKYGAEV